MKVTNNARISFQKKPHTIISFKIIPLEANNIAECNAFNNVRQHYLSEVEKLLALRNSLHIEHIYGYLYLPFALFQ